MIALPTTLHKGKSVPSLLALALVVSGCIKTEFARKPNPIAGETSVTLTCPAASHDDGTGACVSDTQSCAIANGTGSENFSNGAWSACTLVSCNVNYTQVGNACVLTNQSQACAIANGTGSQSSTDGGQTWGVCNVVSCNVNYSNVANACVSDFPDLVLTNGTTNFSTYVSSGRSHADAIAYKVTVNPTGQSSINVGATPDGFAAGDSALLINLQGSSSDNAAVGNYEFVSVTGISGNTITLSSSVTKTYTGTSFAAQKVAIQRVPRYRYVTLSGSAVLTVDAWNGTWTGASRVVQTGILALTATSTVSIRDSAKIDVSQKGFRGGVPGSFGLEDFRGLLTAVPPLVYGAAGGNGSCYDDCGTNGTPAYTAPQVPTPADFSKLYLGTGAARGGEVFATGGAGAAGGGIVYLFADTLDLNAPSVFAGGGTGGTGTAGDAGACDPWWWSGSSGGSGGGQGASGGSIWIRSKNVIFSGSGLVQATGGNGGNGGQGANSCTGPGGAGGLGALFNLGNDAGGNGTVGTTGGGQGGNSGHFGKLRFEYNVLNGSNYVDGSEASAFLGAPNPASTATGL